MRCQSNLSTINNLGFYAGNLVFALLSVLIYIPTVPMYVLFWAMSNHVEADACCMKLVRDVFIQWKVICVLAAYQRNTSPSTEGDHDHVQTGSSCFSVASKLYQAATICPSYHTAPV